MKNKSVEGKNCARKSNRGGVPVICPYCKRYIPGYAARDHERVCKIDYIKVNKYPAVSGTYKKIRRGKSSRKCRVCGDDAWPNYFYCPKCHSRKYEDYFNGD